MEWLEIVLVVVMALAAADLFTSVLLLSVVWFEYRRVRKEAALMGEEVPPASRQLSCLLVFCFTGAVVLLLSAWLLLQLE